MAPSSSRQFLFFSLILTVVIYSSDAARHLFEVPPPHEQEHIPEAPPSPKLLPPPLPEVPYLHKPDALPPLPELQPLPKLPALPPLPEFPALTKPTLPEIPPLPKFALPPLPELPHLPIPTLPTLPEIPTLPKPTLPEFPDLPKPTLPLVPDFSKPSVLPPLPSIPAEHYTPPASP